MKRLSSGKGSVIASDEWSGLAEEIKTHGLRNAATVAAPPTGRSSQLIQHSTASIEPVWSCFTPVSDEISGAQVFNLEVGDTLKRVVINPRLLGMLDRAGVPLDGELTEKIIESRGAIGDIAGIPKEIREVFLTTGEIEPARHIAVVAEIQRHVDEAVSKTVNLPNDATVGVVGDIYMGAWKANLKGITVFRDGCVGEKQQIKLVAKKIRTVKVAG